jgi:hypothetical protein
MGQSMQMTLASVWDWLADLFADKYFVFEIVLLFGIGFVVNRAVNRVVDAQREIAVGLRQELHNLSNKLSSFEEVTVDRLMADIHRRIGH